MPLFIITITYGYQVSDGGDRDDIAAGEGWNTQDDVYKFEGNKEEADKKMKKILKRYKEEPCLSARITEG